MHMLSTGYYILFWFTIQVLYDYMRSCGVAFFTYVSGFLGRLVMVWLACSSVVKAMKTPL